MIAGVLNSQTSAKHTHEDTQEDSTFEWFHLLAIKTFFILEAFKSGVSHFKWSYSAPCEKLYAVSIQKAVDSMVLSTAAS